VRKLLFAGRKNRRFYPQYRRLALKKAVNKFIFVSQEGQKDAYDTPNRWNLALFLNQNSNANGVNK
jgi:hypothetical protein